MKKTLSNKEDDDTKKTIIMEDEKGLDKIKKTTTTHKNGKKRVLENTKKQQFKEKTNETTKKKKKHTVCRFLQCAYENQHTNSLVITRIPMMEEKDTKKKKRQRRITQVMTCVTLPSNNNNDTTIQIMEKKQEEKITSMRIYVRPLIILDLNGVLCHRYRKHKNPYPKDQYQKWYRPAMGMIAMTPIIARTDLTTFLNQLCQHFTIAVWTSAKRRTAIELVKLLFPLHISQQLLFIWAQNKCQCIQRKDNKQTSNHYDDIIFTKRLSKVWEDYPLWNPTNTLLIDDSPDKCPNEYVCNALHPPPLTGLKQGTNHDVSSINHDNNAKKETAQVSPDETNEELQRKFFHKLAMHWITNPSESKQNETVEADNSSLLSFLKQHGSSHMGWRGETKRSS